MSSGFPGQQAAPQRGPADAYEVMTGFLALSAGDQEICAV